MTKEIESWSFLGADVGIEDVGTGCGYPGLPSWESEVSLHEPLLHLDLGRSRPSDRGPHERYCSMGSRRRPFGVYVKNVGNGPLTC